MEQGHLRNLSTLPLLLLRGRVLLCNLELTEEPRLTLDFRSSCPSLPRTLITSMCYHTQQDKVPLKKGTGSSEFVRAGSTTSMHPDSLRNEQQQLIAWAEGEGTTGGTGPGSRTQPWRFTERVNATEVVEDNPQRMLYSSIKNCSSMG